MHSSHSHLQKRRTAPAAALIAACGATALSVVGACDRTQTPPAPQPPVSAQSESVTAVAADASWKRPLLERAFRMAGQLPEQPHARTRARLQEEVATAALDLGMVDLALELGGQIGDWRRGQLNARAAQRFAREGDSTRARACIATAMDVASTCDGWMRERVLTEVATAHVALGEVEVARMLAAQVPPEDTGRVEAALTSRVPEEELDRQADAFDRAIATNSFDLVRSGIEGYLAWYPRIAKDETRADRALAAIRRAAPGLPRDLQITYSIRLADALAAHGGRDECTAELDSAGRILNGTDFLPEDIGPLTSALARACARHGDAATARTLLASARETYAARHADIVDIFRAGYLRPVAEALAETGDQDAAIACWMMALDAGAVNPNSRPRAEDLCRTVLSLVRSGVEPSPELESRIEQMRLGLKDPW